MQAKLSDITQENKHCKHIEKPLKKALKKHWATNEKPLKTVQKAIDESLKKLL